MADEEEMLTEVTPAEWAEVLADLEKSLNISQKSNESLTEYAARLANKGNKLSDEAWNALTEMAQLWINGALTAIELSKPLPIPIDEAAKIEPEDEPEVKRAKDKKKPPADRTRPEAKEAKSANGKSAGKRGRPSKLQMDATLKILVEENPHREGSNDFTKFKTLKDGKPVSASIDAGVNTGYIIYAAKRGFLEVGA